jgi:hypothetical protein
MRENRSSRTGGSSWSRKEKRKQRLSKTFHS